MGSAENLPEVSVFFFTFAKNLHIAQIFYREDMKQAFKFIGGLFLGALIGFAIAFLIILFVDGSEGFERALQKDLDVWKVAFSIACSLVSLLVTVILQLALHEIGHLLFGLASGYRFSSIRLGKYALVKDGDGFHIRKFHIQGTGGQCIMTLPSDTDTDSVPYFWYNAGGVLVNLLLFVLSLVALRNFNLGIMGESFFYMLALTGAGVALLNGVPSSFGGLCNDGRNILLLWRNRRSRRFFLRILQAAGGLSQGYRLRDLPGEWFEDIPLDSPKDYFLLNNRINYAAWLEDLGRFEEARQVYEEIAAFGKEIPGLIKLETGADHILMELLTTARPEVVAQLYDKPLQPYISSSYRYSPVKTVTLYALALLHEGDTSRAQQLLDEMESHEGDYLMPGEYLTAKFLVEKCDALKGAC